MLLYANVGSERASKGQGGNEYVNIELLYQQDGENRVLTRLNLVIEGDTVNLYEQQHGVIASATLNTKGNRQKAEGTIAF